MTKKSKSAKQEPVNPAADIVGTWIREECDEAPYPDELTFAADGIYSGKKAPGSPIASKLDVGVFDRIDETSIRMSTATDRDETFSFDVSADQLKLVDEQGKEFSYKRSPDGGITVPEQSSDVDSPAPDAATTDRKSDEEWMP
jgi:hypothetical protein